jgi:hypothetical protein
MKPGPKLDELIRQKVMYTVSDGIKWMDGGAKYSTDIAAAWQVVERLAPIVGDFHEADGWFKLLYADSADHGDADKGCNPGGGDYGPDDEDLSKWSCHFHPGHPGADTESSRLFKDYRKACARGQTAAHAICLAALRVVGHEF